jgi:hypothetical protein
MLKNSVNEKVVLFHVNMIVMPHFTLLHKIPVLETIR